MNRQPLLLLLLGSSMIGCEHVTGGYVSNGTGTVPTTPTSTGVTATPSVEPSTSATGACNTTQNATVFIGMSSSFTEYDDPTYGEIAGYANATTGTPTQAAAIQATTSDIIQFANFDTTTDHSAVGFPAGSSSGSGFPAQPYAFPTAAASPEASDISSQPWSTGRIVASSSTTCLSQSFQVTTPGTYYFGDFDYYNTITSLRDVIVISRNPSATHMKPRR